jgi:uncharacterized delta-60 repeat protein
MRAVLLVGEVSVIETRRPWNVGRFLWTGCTLLVLIIAPVRTSHGWDGALDAGFAGDGIMAILMGGGNGSSQAALYRADGTYLLAGFADNPNQDFALAGVTPIGSMDGSFGSSGTAFWNGGWGDDSGWDAALQDDGKIVVVGTSRLESASHLTVLRFDADGSLDLTFGYNGYAIIDFGGSSYGRGVAIQPDGKIVVVGVLVSSTLPAVARLDNDGNLDPSFGAGGIYEDGPMVPFGDRDAWDVALMSNGNIVVVGKNYIAAMPPATDGGTFFHVMVTDSDGVRLNHRDIDFGGDSEARAVAVGSDNRFVVVGFTDVDTAIAIARFDSSATLDPSFDGDGKNTEDFGEGVDEGWDLILQPNGRAIVVGSAVIGGVEQCVVLRFLESGSRDKFGPEPGGVPQGYVAFYSQQSSRARGVALLPDAKILVVGDAYHSSWGNLFLAARLEIPSLHIFSDDFELGDTSTWSSTIPQ